MANRAIYLAALPLGLTAGLRTFLPLAAVSWAASLGTLRLKRTPFEFLGSPTARAILTAAAIAELAYDQLPTAGSRKAPAPFGARIASGAMSGAAVAAADGSPLGGLLAGAAGSVVGTLAGSRFRAALARAFRRDRPAAFVEDAVAIGSAALVTTSTLPP
jgi:uncharacterized membrane protein